MPDAVESVCASKGVIFECLIVNDASPDETHDVAEGLAIKHDEVTHVRLSENRGLAGARNAGVSKAKGDYIVCLDADDKMSPVYLRDALEVFDREADIVYVDSILFGTQMGFYRTPDRITLDMQLERNCFSYASAYRRRVWEEIGGYDEDMRIGFEDFEFWIRALKTGFRPKKLHGKYFFYRKHGESMIDDAMRRRGEIIEYIRSKHPDFTGN